MTKPYVIALEGIPGSGKTTLRKTLHIDDLKIERVEQILPGDPDSDDNFGIEDIMVSDFLKTERIINTTSDVVVLDRYFLSTLAYQESYDKIYNLNTRLKLIEEYERAFEDGRLIRPNVTFYIDIPLEESYLRKERKSGDKLWVNDLFLQYNQRYYDAQNNLYYIDGLRDLDSIKLEIEDFIRKELIGE